MNTNQNVVMMLASRSLFLLAVPAALTAGCAQEVGQEQDTTGSATSEALNSTECAPATVPVDYINSGSMSYISPRTYSNPHCYKAVVAEVDNISASYTQTGTATNAGITVAYSDNDLTDAASCADAMAGGYLYQWSGSAWVLVDAEFHSGGIWLGGFFGCAAPKVFFDGPTYITANGAYRVAATARRESSNATRVVSLSTDFAQNQP